MMKPFIFLPLALLPFSGCTLDQGQRLFLEAKSVEQTDTRFSAEELSYQIVNDQVLKQNCLTCHSQAGGNKGGVNLETYANVYANKEDIRADVFDQSMPLNGRLTNDQIKIVTDWIDHGASEFAPGNQPVPTEPPPTVDPQPEPPSVPPAPHEIYFKEVFEKVIQTNCLKCHSAGSDRGDVNLETYTEVFKRRSAIQKEVVDRTMPPKRGVPLTDEQRDLILKWLENGAPEKAPEKAP